MPRVTARNQFVRGLYWAGVLAVIVGVALRFAFGLFDLGLGVALIGVITIAAARVVAGIRR